MNEKYILKINDKTEYFDNFKEGYEKCKDAILNHIFNEQQVYNDVIPFNFGCYFSYLFDNLIVTDHDILVYEKTILLLNHLFDEEDRIYNFFKSDLYLESEDEEISLEIVKDEDLITLKLKTEEDYLFTNIFNRKENVNYYFMSKQRVITKSPEEKRELGEIVEIKVEYGRIYA